MLRNYGAMDADEIAEKVWLFHLLQSLMKVCVCYYSFLVPVG